MKQPGRGVSDSAIPESRDAGAALQEKSYVAEEDAPDVDAFEAHRAAKRGRQTTQEPACGRAEQVPLCACSSKASRVFEQLGLAEAAEVVQAGEGLRVTLRAGGGAVAQKDREAYCRRMLARQLQSGFSVRAYCEQASRPVEFSADRRS